MSRFRLCQMVTGFGLSIACVALLYNGAQSNAQPKSAPSMPMYQYVGVEQTIARVDVSSGKIEILARPREPKASLLTPDPRPWEWREVPVRAERTHDAGKDEPSRETPPKPGIIESDLPDSGN